MSVRIALIHATPVAMEPIQVAFRQSWPQAEIVNILDDSLAADRAKEEELSESMFGRFERLTRYAVDYGARGILYTCSAFGPAIQRSATAVSIPVLKPNEAMFEAALAAGKRIGMVATFAAAVKSMETEFEEAACGGGASLRTVLAEGAIEALRAGDEVTHNRLVAEASERLGDADAILLAHFSTSRALSEVSARVRTPVFTAPDAAVAKLRSLVID